MKRKSKSTSQINHGFIDTPTNPMDAQLNAEIAAGEQADPSLQYQYARRKKSLKNLIGSPFGANYAPETAAAIQYAGENDLDQQYGQALQEDAFRRKQSRFGKLTTLAQMRAPKFVTTGGTNTTEENAADFWNSLIAGGISKGLGFLTGGTGGAI
jgi:hypothetical protein